MWTGVWTGSPLGKKGHPEHGAGVKAGVGARGHGAQVSGTFSVCGLYTCRSSPERRQRSQVSQPQILEVSLPPHLIRAAKRGYTLVVF